MDLFWCILTGAVIGAAAGLVLGLILSFFFNKAFKRVFGICLIIGIALGVWVFCSTETYDVNFCTYDGTIVQEKLSENDNFAARVPSRDGYRFLGYYTGSEDGLLCFDENGNMVQGLVIDGGKTFYAHWEMILYTLRLDAGEGTLLQDTVAVCEGDDLLLPEPIPATGYEFVGWIDSNGKNHTGDGALFFHVRDFRFSGTEITLTAVYRSRQLKVTLDDGSPEPAVKTVGYGDPLPDLPLIDTGAKRILGWSLSSGFVQELPKTVTEDLYLYAIWEPYTVLTLDFLNGETKTVKIPDNGKSTTIEDGVRTGYSFDGWYRSTQFSGFPVEQITYEEARGTTLYAKWVSN